MSLDLDVPRVDPPQAPAEEESEPKPTTPAAAEDQSGNPLLAALMGLGGLALLALLGGLWYGAGKRKKQRLIAAARS